MKEVFTVFSVSDIFLSGDFFSESFVIVKPEIQKIHQFSGHKVELLTEFVLL